MLNKINLKIFLLLGFLVINSCRKLDVISIAKMPTETRSKFFTEHRSADLVEAAFVDFIKRQDEQKHFVEKTVRQIGYPYWNKAVKAMRSVANVAGKNSNDSTEIIYVPFVRDSQNYVNAALIINISPGADTTFNYACDWQYFQKNRDAANNHAVFFMGMDKNVFGAANFEILDKNLFKDGNHEAQHVELADDNGGTAGKMVAVQRCSNITVTYCTTPDADECINGCDFCSICFSSNSYNYCWIDFIDDGTGSGTGGGTGGGGDGQPPEPCTSSKPFQARNEPGNGVGCPPGPGWTPPPADTTPCGRAAQGAINATELLKKQAINTRKTELIANIDTLSEKMFLFGKTNATDTVYTATGMFVATIGAGAITIPANWPGLSSVHGAAHSHADGYNAPSAGDIYKFMENNAANSNFQYLYTFAQGNNNYVFTITDPVAFANFKVNYPKASNFTDSTGDWKEGSEVHDASMAAYRYFKDSTGKSENEAFELSQAFVISKFNMGMVMSKQGVDGKFTPVFVKEMPHPINPLKKIYSRTAICNLIIITAIERIKQ